MRYHSFNELTQSFVLLVQLSLFFLATAAADSSDDNVNVAEDDERRREHWPFMESHDQLIPLEFPHLV